MTKEGKKPHYVGMAGLHGYMPQYVGSFESHELDVESISQVHELGKRRTAELRRDGYIELNLHRDGNEYCEISECDCNDIDSHNA